MSIPAPGKNAPIGLIGLGLMGGAVAHRLTGAGFPVLAFDVNPEKPLLLAGMAGVEVAASADDICLRCDRVVLAVYDTAQVEAVVQELETTAHPMDVLCTTTVEPRKIAFIAARAARYGITLIEAPISGTSAQLEAGKGLGLLAGPPGAVDRVADLLEAICPVHFNLGSPGNASKAKMAINLVQQLNRAALAEGLVFAERLGLKPAEFLQLLRASPAASNVMTEKGEKMVRREYSPQSHIAQTLKDAKTMLETAHRLGQNLPMMEANATLLAIAIALGGDERDSAAVIEAIRSSRPK